MRGWGKRGGAWEGRNRGGGRGGEEGRGGEGRFREDVTVWGGGVQQLMPMYIISVVDF